MSCHMLFCLRHRFQQRQGHERSSFRSESTRHFTSKERVPACQPLAVFLRLLSLMGVRQTKCFWLHGIFVFTTTPPAGPQRCEPRKTKAKERMLRRFYC